jgi:predicted nucleic-acid-binding protein
VIGLDTNVLVRYLTQDDPVQASRATRIIDNAGPAELFLNSIVVCEVVWVLEDVYRLKRHDIATTIQKILQTAQFAFEHKDLLWRALADYQHGKGDLSDYLIGHISQAAGCSHTLTFDNALKGSAMFRLL